MPYVNDFSDAFEISLPLPTIRTASDSLAVSESLSRSVSTWKVVESHTDSVSTAESLSTPSVTTYRTTVSTSDSVSLSESLARSLDTWEYIISHSDSVATAESLIKSTYAYRTTVTTSDSLSSSESLARSLDTWEYILSNSDSISTAESLAKSIYTYRTTVSASDSIGSSESLGRAVETWRHILSHSMGMSLSESLSRTIYTYRTSVSSSDSIGTSEGLALLVETWKYVESNSNSIVTAESLSRAVENWRQILTHSDNVSISDSFTAQIKIDGDTYFYDNIGLETKSRLHGYISNGNFTSDLGRISNSIGLVDGNINSPTTFSNTTACVVFDLASSQSINFLALYLVSGSGQSIKLYGSNSQGSGYNLIATASVGDNQWIITEFNSISYRYFAIQLESISSTAEVNEILIGTSLKPEIRYSLNSKFHYSPNNILSESYTGNEYIFQKGNSSNKYDLKYSNISSSLKNKFQNLWEKSSHKKLLYYDNTAINYVMLNPISFDEIAYNRYSTFVSFYS